MYNERGPRLVPRYSDIGGDSSVSSMLPHVRLCRVRDLTHTGRAITLNAPVCGYGPEESVGYQTTPDVQNTKGHT